MSLSMNFTMKAKPELGQPQSSKPVAQTHEQRVDTVDVDASLEDVLNRLRETGRRCLPVVNEEQECFGVLGTKDIAKLESLRGADKSLRAWELCSHKLIEADESVSLERAGEIMLEHSVHHVVINKDGKLLSIISSNDVIRELLAKVS
jgi:CBS domain-containing protein